MKATYPIDCIYIFEFFFFSFRFFFLIFHCIVVTDSVCICTSQCHVIDSFFSLTLLNDISLWCATNGIKLNPALYIRNILISAPWCSTHTIWIFIDYTTSTSRLHAYMKFLSIVHSCLTQQILRSWNFEGKEEEGNCRRKE